MAGATKDKKIRASEEHNRRLWYYCGLLSGSLLLASGLAGRRLFRLPGWPFMCFTTSITGLCVAITNFRWLYNSNIDSRNKEEENVGIGTQELIVTSDIILTKENVDAKDNDETNDNNGTKDSDESKGHVEVVGIFEAKIKSTDFDEVRNIVDTMNYSKEMRTGESIDNAEVIDKIEDRVIIEAMENVEVIHSPEESDDVEIMDNAETVDNAVTMDAVVATESTQSSKELKEIVMAKDSDYIIVNANATDIPKEKDNVHAKVNIKVEDNIETHVKITDAAEVTSFQVVEAMKNPKVTIGQQKTGNIEEMLNVETINHVKAFNAVEVIYSVKAVDQIGTSGKKEETDNVDGMGNVETVGTAESTERTKFSHDFEEHENVKEIDNVEATANAEDRDIFEAEENSRVPCSPKEMDNFKAIDSIKTVDSLESVNNAGCDGNFEVTDAFKATSDQVFKSMKNAEVTEMSKEMDCVEAIYSIKTVHLEVVNDVEVMDTVKVTDITKAIMNTESRETSEATDNTEEIYSVEAIKNAEVLSSPAETDNVTAIVRVETIDKAMVETIDNLEEAANPEKADKFGALSNVKEMDNLEITCTVRDNTKATESTKTSDDLEVIGNAKETDIVMNNIESNDKAEFGDVVEAMENAKVTYSPKETDNFEAIDSIKVVDNLKEVNNVKRLDKVTDDTFEVTYDNVEDMDTVKISDSAEACINTEYNSGSSSTTEDRDIVEATQNFEITDSPDKTDNFKATVNIETLDNDIAINFSEATDNPEETNKIDAKIDAINNADNFKTTNTVGDMDSTKVTDCDKDIDNVSERDSVSNFEANDIAEANINAESKDNTEATKETDNFRATVNCEETDNVKALDNGEAMISNVEAVNKYKATNTVEATDDSAETDVSENNKVSATNNPKFNDNLETDIVKATDNIYDNINDPAMKNVDNSCTTGNVGTTGQVEASEQIKTTTEVKIIDIVEIIGKAEAMDSVKATDNDGDKFNTKYMDNVEAMGNFDVADSFDGRYIVKAEEFVGIPDIAEVEEWYTVKAKETDVAADDIREELIFEARDQKSQIEQEVKKTSEKYINESKRTEVNKFLSLNEQHLKREGSHVAEIPNQCISNSNDDLSFIPPNTSSGIGVLFRKSSSARLSAEFSNAVFSNENDDHVSNSFTEANNANVTSNINLSKTLSKFQDIDTWLTKTVSGSYENFSTRVSPVSFPDTERITSSIELSNFLDQNMLTSPYSSDDTTDGGIILGPSQSKGVSNSPVVYFKNQTCDSAVLSSQSRRNTSNTDHPLTQRRETEPGTSVLSNLPSDTRKNILKSIDSVPDVSSRSSSEISCLEAKKKATESKHDSVASTDTHSPKSSIIPPLSPSVKSQKSCIEDALYSPRKSNEAFSQSTRSPTEVASNSPKFDDVESQFRHKNSTKYNKSFQSTSPNSPPFPRNTRPPYLDGEDFSLIETPSPTIHHGSSFQPYPSGFLRSHDKKNFRAKEGGYNLRLEEHSLTITEQLWREDLGISTPRIRHYSSPSRNVEAHKMPPQRLSSSLTSLDKPVSVSNLSRDTKSQEMLSQGISISLTSLDRSVIASNLLKKAEAEEMQPQRRSISLTSIHRSVNDSFDDHLEVLSFSQEKDSMVEEFLST